MAYQCLKIGRLSCIMWLEVCRKQFVLLLYILYLSCYGIQDTLPSYMAGWCITYLKLKKCEKTAEEEGQWPMPLILLP